MVLDQNADKTLHRAHYGTMPHDRVLSLTVLVHVLGAQALGHHEIDLHGANLPGATDRVLHVVLDLGTVEGTLTRQLLPAHPGGTQRRAQGILGAVPDLVAADALV